MATNISDQNIYLSDNLFASLAEQIKIPFTQIKYATALLDKYDNLSEQSEILTTISQASSSALGLIDSYLMNVELGRQSQLQLEQVSMSSVIYDVAQSLDGFAKLHNCRLEISIAGKYGPIMANNRAIFLAYKSLGYSFIEAVSDSEKTTTIDLSVRRSKTGISTGIFAEVDLSSSLMKVAHELKGKAHQPFIDFNAGPGAGLFLADEILSKLGSEIRKSRFKGQSGLSATFLLSNQLSLV